MAHKLEILLGEHDLQIGIFGDESFHPLQELTPIKTIEILERGFAVQNEFGSGFGVNMMIRAGLIQINGSGFLQHA